MSRLDTRAERACHEARALLQRQWVAQVDSSDLLTHEKLVGLGILEDPEGMVAARLLKWRQTGPRPLTLEEELAKLEGLPVEERERQREQIEYVRGLSDDELAAMVLPLTWHYFCQAAAAFALPGARPRFLAWARTLPEVGDTPDVVLAAELDEAARQWLEVREEVERVNGNGPELRESGRCGC